jgi:hypothetical protein
MTGVEKPELFSGPKFTNMGENIYFLTLPVRLQSGDVAVVTPDLPQLPVRTLSQKLPRHLNTIGIFRRARLYDGAHRLRAGFEPLSQLRILSEQRCRRRVGGEKIRERLEVLCRDDLLDLGVEAGVVGEDGRVLPPVASSSVRRQGRHGQRHEDEMHDGLHDWDRVAHTGCHKALRATVTQFSAGVGVLGVGAEGFCIKFCC